MVIKTDLCSFSEWRIYPGHGRRFVAKDGRLFYYLNQKSRAFSARKIKSQEIQWTVAWRRLNKKIKTDEGAKKRRIRNLKVQRAIVGISLEEIRRRRKEDDKTRKAQAEQAAREIKDRKQKQIEAQKKKPAAAQKVAQKAEVKAQQKAQKGAAKANKGKK
ncbi:unnamed protein product [Paramecium primaurelia]|uniref:Chromosome undetermined scaffold_14, whole genome shotgun sequence n=3 Tax=Paramecium TaxID=5884 RepID=A0C096_PARTE|nr:uncharacterized protein GSPATT00006066001 [Paramecium tetraurelia]XP_001447117.1 uncharacterized protein GSPATT00014650001 [Paramecium tetraurelia]CAD8072945.1 unnamed protein product [Paramecium primaurelia]CAD8149467.1 unnamed protein product [Paramecium octaurelia]CAD8174137.1 unnamed protein product [Paramecium octaurelia]CAK64213.1 unnamed protein product [Paramecium tetraurelia]CAK79720.1 unnamed protein product [Paramecium tetraurelia]|eukprot:XP_001431611.1 hypothetical protein (macronuclear) [Paramecium tetraurelia strain d4-2]